MHGLPDSYEVAAIVAHKWVEEEKQFRFRVRWRGFSSDHDTWEPPESFDDPGFVRKYMECQRLLGRTAASSST